MRATALQIDACAFGVDPVNRFESDVVIALIAAKQPKLALAAIAIFCVTSIAIAAIGYVAWMASKGG
jgi:uncharacterized membrane protein YidH (DUF202 family)